MNAHENASKNYHPQPQSDSFPPPASDPTQSPSYILAPLSTILESIEPEFSDCISPHDLLDAYNTLAHRLRILISGSAISALDTLKARAPQLAEALARDVRAASRGSLDHSSMSDASLSFLSDPRKRMTPDQMQSALDIALLAQYALRVISDVLRSSVLHSIFNPLNLDTLLDALLGLLHVPPEMLPILSAHKTYALAVFAIREQRLPADILSQRGDEIAAALREALRVKGVAMEDALKSIHNLCKYHPKIFVIPLADLLPSILPLLLSPSRALRISVVRALSGLALATLSNTSLSFHRTHIRTFVNANYTSLATIFKPTSGPYLTMLSAFVLLAGPSLFAHPRLLKFLLSSFERIRTPRRRVAWCCLIWAFAGFNSGDADMYARAFRVVSQEIGGGAGVSLVGTLLSAKDAEHAVEVVGWMATDDAAISGDGVRLLGKLTGAEISDRKQCSEWKRSSVIPHALLDGRVLSEKWEALRGEETNLFARVRCLEAEELNRCWESLLKIWTGCVERAVVKQGDRVLTDDFVRIWQRLLLAQTQLTQGRGHLTAGADATAHITVVLTTFCTLPDILRRLWGVVRNVFAQAWLARPAELVLNSVTARGTSKGEAEERVWEDLCIDLVEAAGVQAIGNMCDGEGERRVDEERDGRRRLWRWVTKRWVEEDRERTGTELVSLLVLPFSLWDMSDYEIDLWESLFRHTVSSVGSTGAAVDAFIAQLHTDWPTRSPKAVLALLEYVDLAERTTIPAKLCRLIDQTLFTLYPPPADLVETALDILRFLRKIVASVPTPILVSLIVALGRGLCIWIEDKNEVIPENVYNDVVATLYRDLVGALHTLPPAISTLDMLSMFLASAFVRIPSPALGPMAFSEFLRTTYHRVVNPVEYPERIKVLLLALGDAFASDLAEGLSFDTESLITLSFMVPDSQPDSGHRSDEHAAYDADANILYDMDDGSATLMRKAITAHSGSSRTPLALHQLEQYSSGLEDSFNDTVASNMRGVFGLQPHDSQVFSGRPGNGESRKTDPEAYSLETTRDTVDGEDAPPQNSTRSKGKAQGAVGKATSEPVTRAPSPPVQSRQPPRSIIPRKRAFLDYVEVVPLRELLKRPRNADNQPETLRSPLVRQCSRSTNSSILSRTRSPLQASSSSDVDDYDSWEAGLTTPEARRIQREPVNYDSSEVPETEAWDSSQQHRPSPRTESEPILERTFALNSPSQEATMRGHARSQTAPAQPLRRARTTSSRLDTLHEAYAFVTNDASQMPVQDLLQATRLVHQISSVLNEQISKKLSNNG